MGIRNRDGALFTATGFDNTGMYAGRREAIGIIKAMTSEITSFDVFSGIGISAATAFAKAAKSSYDFEKEFYKNMLEVATISTQVTNDMTGFMNQVMSITQEIPVTAPEAAKALYQIVSAGHDGAAGMKVLEVSARSAIGGMTDTATAADAITTLLNAYKLSADDAEKVSDQLFTTARLGKTTFGELGQSIAQVAPIAASYGVEMDQVLAAVATLTKSGTPTAQAMTQIRASIIGTSKVLGDGAFNTRTFQEALAEVATMAGGSESKLRELIPEVEAVNGVLGMTGIKAQDAASDLKAMNDSVGATEEAFQKMMDDVDKQMTLLSNNIQAALRPMGQAILKEVSEVAKAFNEAFENREAKEAMKSLGDLVVIVTGAFIGYKGAVLASTAVQKINIAILRQTVLERHLERAALFNGVVGHQALTAAQLKEIAARKIVISTIKVQTAAMLKCAAAVTNPYILAATAISFLGYQVYKYATQVTEAEKAQQRYNSRIEEQKQLADEMKGKTDQLLEVVKDETETNYQRNKALKTLKDLYPSIFKQYDIEALKLADVLNIKKQIAEIDEQRNFQSDKGYYASLVSKRDKLDEELSYRSENYGNGQYKYGEFYGKTVNELKKERDGIAKDIDLMYSDIRDKSAAIWEKSTPKEVKIISLEKNIESLQKEKEELEKVVNPNNEFITGNQPSYNPLGQTVSLEAIARLREVNRLLEEQTGELKSLGNNSTKTKEEQSSVSMEISNTTVKIAKLKQELSDLRSGKTSAEAGKTVQSAIEEKTKELKTAEDALSTLTGQTTKETSERLKLQQDLTRSILDSELKLQSGRIAAMEDGKAKRIALAKQETSDTIAAIQKEKAEYQTKVKESKDKVDPTVIKTFDNRELAAKEKEKADIARIEKEYAEEYKQRTKALTDVFLNEEERKLSAVKTRYDEERKWADQQLKTGGMTKDEHKSYTTDIDKAQQQETYRSLLDNLNDYKQQEKDLRDKWDTDIAVAAESKDAYLVAKLMEGKQKALSALNGQMLQETNEWQQLFGDLDNLTVTQIDNLLSIIEDKAKDLKLNPVDLREVTNSLNQAKQKVIELNPFKSLGDSIKTVFSSSSKDSKQSSEDIKKDWNNMAKSTEGCFEFVNDAVSSCGVLKDIIGESGQEIIGMIQGVAVAGIAMATAIKTAETASVVLAAISLALQAVTALFSLFNGDKKHEKKIERLQDQVDALDKSYEKLGDAIEKAYSKDASNLINQQNKLLEQQKVLIQQQIREEEDKKKTDKDRIKDWKEQIEEINKTITDNKEKAVDAIFGEDLKSAIENFADAYANAWTSGEERVKSAKDTVKNMMRQMVTESIKAAMESSKSMEKIRDKLKEFYSDNVLSGWEQDYIYNMAEDLQKELDRQFGWADSLMKDEQKPEEEVSDNSLKGAYAKASQESIDLLAGQTGAMRVVMEDIKNQMQPIREQMKFIYDLQKEGWQDVKAIKDLTEKVDKNTEQIAENTKQIRETMGEIGKDTRRSADALDGGTINAKVKM